MRKIIITAVVAVALLGAGGLVLRVGSRTPPALPQAHADAVVGSFHVHSEMSHDSSLSLGEIVAAAREAGLDFVVLADHNRQYAGSVVREGVAVIAAAELSTPGGHVIQLGATRVLDREERRAADVHGRIREAGALPIVAHPTDPKRPWVGSWDGAGGLEIANFASSARRRGGRALLGLVPLAAAALVNRPLALAQVYDRDTEALAAWDARSETELRGFCGVDAHGWIDLATNLAAWTLVLEGPLPADEAARPAWILSRLAAGRFHCSAGLFGGPIDLRLEARGTAGVAAVAPEAAQAATVEELVATTDARLPGQRLVVFRNGLAVGSSEGGELRYASPTPASYRVELWTSVPDLVAGQHLAPIAYSNRLRLTPDTAPPAAVGAAP